MYAGSEKYYDDIYASAGKDYAAEAKTLHQLIHKYKKTKGNLLLDVACGTGTHAGYLCQYYKVEGTDLNPNMLKSARKKHPDIRFTQGDMRDFDLHQQFDVVTCLFSAIGYMTKQADLQKAVRNMARHLLPGGVLMIEPWFAPDQWHVGNFSSTLVDKPGMKIIRMSHSGKKGRVSIITFEYLVGTPKGIEHFSEVLELGLYTHKEYLNAFIKAGLNVTHDPEGVYGRGLYIGTKPS
jgi:ubiquinone/menaquinone biosynthesis C-methylase UbiE